MLWGAVVEVGGAKPCLPLAGFSGGGLLFLLACQPLSHHVTLED